MSRLLKNTCFAVLTLLVLLSISCEEFTEWNIEPDDTYLVVDALITNELKQHKIYVYSSVNKLNEYPLAISGAVIKVIGHNQIISFTENTLSPGEYISDSVFSVAGGVNYQMTIEYGNRRDTAISHLVAISPLEAAIIEPEDEYYKYIYLESSLPSMLDVSYDWSGVSQFCTYYGSCYASQTFYTLNNLDISNMFAPAKQQIVFPRGTVITRRKYSLSEEHQSFIRSLLMETEWRGGIFDLEPGNVPSNFKHGTLGWFGTSMVLSDTIYF